MDGTMKIHEAEWLGQVLLVLVVQVLVLHPNLVRGNPKHSCKPTKHVESKSQLLEILANLDGPNGPQAPVLP